MAPLSSFNLPPFSHPTLPLQTIRGLIAAAWGELTAPALESVGIRASDRSPSGFMTRLRLHNADYKGFVTDMKGLGKHSKSV